MPTDASIFTKQKKYYNSVYYVLHHPVLWQSISPAKKQIKSFVEQHEKILIVEEGYPVYEELLRGYFGGGIKIDGGKCGAEWNSCKEEK